MKNTALSRIIGAVSDQWIAIRNLNQLSDDADDLWFVKNTIRDSRFESILLIRAHPCSKPTIILPSPNILN